MTHDEMEAERSASLERILQSSARLKVVVAGPGTGKTHTFRKMLDGIGGEVLVLSFLGNLVADLEAALGDHAEVKTFHGYCRKLLHAMPVGGITQGVDYYPCFVQIAAEDVSLVLDQPVEAADLEKAFMLLDDSGQLPVNALQSGNYYNAVGHTDSVYRVHRALSGNPGLTPSYAQVLVDEYQDFSLLEVALIEELSGQSPTLIAGDDDQALYSFKHASPEHLRRLVDDPRFTRFELPFCSRCPSVLVEATHRVVEEAQQLGLLTDRIDKTYLCYLPDKVEQNTKYPKILHARCSVQRNSSPYISRYIAAQIASISDEDVTTSRKGGHPTVLIVGPMQFTRQVFRFLVAEGFPNVEMRASARLEIDALDGYRRLAKDPASRLGWRILLSVHVPSGSDDAVRSALLDNKELADLLDPDFKALHLDVVALLQRFLEGAVLTPAEEGKLEWGTGHRLADLRLKLGLDQEPDVTVIEDAPSIVLTSLVGAKGLQAEHVFVVGLNEQHFPIDNVGPTDVEVCELLVALTRARASCTLVSCDRFGAEKTRPSVFLKWLGPMIESRYISAAYWN